MHAHPRSLILATPNPHLSEITFGDKKQHMVFKIMLKLGGDY
jgi:hypothetical protein